MEIQLRGWELSDLNNLVSYANNINIAKNLTDQFPHPYTMEAGKKFIDQASLANPIHIFAITLNNEAIGGIGIHPKEDISKKNAELGYWLAEPFWGKGILSQTIPKMVAYTFANFDINRIYARPFGSNIASQKVLEKNGFILETSFKNTFFKNGKFEDELIYAIRKPS